MPADELYAAGRRAWPGIEVDRARFAAHAARHSKATHGADLYLALACAEGAPGALEALERRYLPEVLEALRRQDKDGALGREVQQRLRVKLLLPQRAAPPRIADYAGRGPLGAWLCAAAIRLAVDLRRAEKAGPELNDDALADAGTPDAELEAIKAEHRETFREAFRAALGSLTAQQRTLLRNYVIDGLTLEELASHHGVHFSTVSRWVARAREQLYDETRRRLTERLRLGRGELSSLLRVLRSRIDVSIEALLKK